MRSNWWSWSRQKAKPLDVESIPLNSGVSVKDSLIRTVANIGDNAPISDLKDVSVPYFAFLEATFRRIAPDILKITHTTSLVDSSPAGQTQRLYEIVGVIASKLGDGKNHIFLRDLCNELEQRGLVQPEPTIPNGASHSGSGTHTQASQLVFILLGALTMLYTPRTDPCIGKIQMRQTFGVALQRRGATTWHTDSQDLPAFGDDITFDDLLGRYSRSHYGPVPCPSTRDPTHEPSLLRSEDLSFYTLAQLLGVRIAWTTSICEHLEFDSRSKQLKLFRFPSYCVLLCLLEPDKTYLDGLFRNLLEDDNHQDARELIKKFCGQGRILGFKNPFRDEHPSAFVKDTADPLLEELCFKDSRRVHLFAELDIVDLKNIYNLDGDFPYFAERLTALKSFVENQCPHDWKVLWRDRRDVAKFWTIWAVMLFGIPSLLISVIQTILTGFQLQGE
ncbi:hypothetical protein CEP52_015362 [Fusarium oligoseptatum]|uniref:Uncharacterized protein n=1 Tax=Fusarium oligoseptatum TaxID=2604345 RepID=A0A428SE21_9HYPO|nr:hypothetical protein CEP52_015362 [Fusarium oligoseptatum]